MEFKIENIQNPNINKYKEEDIQIAHLFTKRIHKEFGELLKAVVLFGSAARKTSKEAGDVDVLIIINDLEVVLNQEITETYRIIVEKIVAQTSKRLHITTLKLTSFWEFVRAGDPIIINLLRDGVPLFDAGFFEPVQELLKQGRVRPSKESIWTYYARAPTTLHNSKWHLLQATLDLYWAVIDSAHAALMKIGEIPPSPSHVADMLNEKLVRKKQLEKKYVDIMNRFYKLAKMIMHRELIQIKGYEYDRYYREARNFVERMKKFIEMKPPQ